MCNSNSFKKGDVVCAEYKSYSHFYKEYSLESRTTIVQSESEKYLFVDCIMECDSDYVFVNNGEIKLALRKDDYTTIRLATENEKNRLFEALAKKGVKFDYINKK